jgi:hypothetical protein
MLHWRMAHMGPAVTAEIARAKLAGLMVDRKELKIHKIDSMSRDQLELRLQQLVQENQIVLGQATEIVEDEDEELEDLEVSQDQKDLEESLGEEILEEALEDSEDEDSHLEEDDLPER